ncbi:hypothetical protein AAEX62_09390 [Luteococcus sp. H154]
MAILLAREWRNFGGDFDSSWAEVGPRIMALVSAAQTGAAYDGALSMHRQLVEGGAAIEPSAVIIPGAWAGWSDEGLPIDRLLYNSVVQMRTTDAGSLDERLKIGFQRLVVLSREQVGNAGRSASQVAIAARPGAGYTRMVNPPCCKDCALQAGRFFRWNAGFQRHPGCDCVHVAVAGGSVPRGHADDVPTSQIHDLTDGERLALESGADLSQVVNSQRGPSKAGRWTTESTTRRGMHHGKGRRMTPDAILAQAKSQDDAVRLLTENGYMEGLGRGKDFEGYGQYGRGGTRVGARHAVEQARITGVRDPGSIYTMTAAELRRNKTITT